MAIQDLVDVMRQLTDAHRQLLDIAGDKKEAIIHNQVDKLNQLVNKEAKLVRQVAELEQKRQFEMSRFLVGKGYRPNSAVTVSELAKIVFRLEEKQALLNARFELVEVLSKLKRINELNQKMIRQSLAFIEYSYDLLFGPPEEDVVYRNPHQQKGSIKRSGVLDIQA